MNKNGNKKIPIFTACFLMILLFLLLLPQKTKAMVVVDYIVEAETTAIAGTSALTAGSTAATAVTSSATSIGMGSLVAKEFLLDEIAFMLAKTVLHKLTQNTVQWIRSGFQGNPLFITDFQGFMMDAADQATGRFFKEYLNPQVYNAICSPFRTQLLLALKRKSSFGDRVSCTLNSVISNVDNFFNDFNQGGWNTWLALTSDRNNYYGAFLTSYDELLGRQNAARNNARTESIFNNGFISMKKCTNEYLDEWTGENVCTNWETTSPGKWIEDQLAETTSSDIRQLELADEIDEIVTALIQQMMSYALSGGAGSKGISKSSSSAGGGPNNQPLRNSFLMKVNDNLIEVSAIWNTAANTANFLDLALATYQTAKVCYSRYEEDNSQSQQSQIASIDNETRTIETKNLPPVNQEFQMATVLVDQLKFLKSQIPAANSSDFLEKIQILSNEYSELQTQIQELKILQTEIIEQRIAEQKSADADSRLLECQHLKPVSSSGAAGSSSSGLSGPMP